MSPGKTATGYEVVIVGAGVCGLTLANALAQNGHRVRVLEEMDAHSEMGSSFAILPPAAKLLTRWGLDEELKQYATPIRCFTSRDGATGKFLGHTPCNISNTALINYEAEWYNIRRRDYVALLLKALEARDVEVEMGARLEEVDVENARVTCQDGRNFEADVVIGADGIASKTRGYIEGISDVQIKEWPEHCYSCRVNKDKMLSDPELKSLLDPTKLDGASYMHEGKYALTWQMKPESAFEMILGVAERAGDVSPAQWRQWDKPEDVPKEFGHFCPQVSRPLEGVQEVMKWNVADIPELPLWSSQNGRVVLVGDAAHAMIPHAAAGPTSAIEDAAVLGETLTWAFSQGKPISAAAKAFEEIRKPRVTKLQQISRDHCGFLSASGDFATKRNLWIEQLDRQMWEDLSIPEEQRRKAPKAIADMNEPFPAQWIYGYDAVKEVKSYLTKSTGTQQHGI